MLLRMAITSTSRGRGLALVAMGVLLAIALPGCTRSSDRSGNAGSQSVQPTADLLASGSALPDEDDFESYWYSQAPELHPIEEADVILAGTVEAVCAARETEGEAFNRVVPGWLTYADFRVSCSVKGTEAGEERTCISYFTPKAVPSVRLGPSEPQTLGRGVSYLLLLKAPELRLVGRDGPPPIPLAVVDPTACGAGTTPEIMTALLLASVRARESELEYYAVPVLGYLAHFHGQEDARVALTVLSERGKERTAAAALRALAAWGQYAEGGVQLPAERSRNGRPTVSGTAVAHGSRQTEILLAYDNGRDQVGFQPGPRGLWPVVPRGFLPVADGGFYVDDTANRAIKRFRSDGTADLVVPYPEKLQPAMAESWLGVADDALYIANPYQLMCIGMNGSVRWTLEAPGEVPVRGRPSAPAVSFSMLRNGKRQAYPLGTALPDGWEEADVVGASFSRINEYHTALVVDSRSVRIGLRLQPRTEPRTGLAFVTIELTHDGDLLGRAPALIRDDEGTWYDLSELTTTPRMIDACYDLSVNGRKVIKQLGRDCKSLPPLDISVPALTLPHREVIGVDWLLRPDGSLFNVRYFLGAGDALGLEAVLLDRDSRELGRCNSLTSTGTGLPMTAHVDPSGNLWTWRSTDEGVRITKCIF